MFIAMLVGFFSSGCSGADRAMLRYLEHRYPNCAVLKIEEAPFDQRDVTIQCPMSPPKVITIKRQR
jgi:hypothetical protein